MRSILGTTGVHGWWAGRRWPAGTPVVLLDPSPIQRWDVLRVVFPNGTIAHIAQAFVRGWGRGRIPIMPAVGPRDTLKG